MPPAPNRWRWLKERLAAVLAYLGGWLKGGVAFAVAVAVVVFAGRAGLFGTSRLVVEQISSAPTVPGVIYYLPRTTLRLEVIFQIRKCVLEPQGANAQAQVSLDATVSVQLTTLAEPDTTRGYVIRADSLTGTFCNSDVTVELQNSVLKSINSTIESAISVPKEFQIGSIITQISNTLPKSIPQPAGESESLQDQQIKLCGTALIEALAGQKGSGPDPTIARRELRWLFDGNCPNGMDPLPPAEPNAVSCILKGIDTVGVLLARPREAGESLQRFNIQTHVLERARAASRPAVGKDIVYRTAGEALVRICLVSCGNEEGARLLEEKWLPIAQWGAEGAIPVERRLFSERTMQLDFAPTGDLTRAKFIDKSTPPSPQ
jgi:hypothetical protein